MTVTEGSPATKVVSGSDEQVTTSTAGLLESDASKMGVSAVPPSGSSSSTPSSMLFTAGSSVCPESVTIPSGEGGVDGIASRAREGVRTLIVTRLDRG